MQYLVAGILKPGNNDRLVALHDEFNDHDDAARRARLHQQRLQNVPRTSMRGHSATTVSGEAAGGDRRAVGVRSGNRTVERRRHDRRRHSSGA